MGDELWCGQAKNGVFFYFDLKIDLEGQGRLPHKTRGTLTKEFCIFDPNLVILAWTGDEWSRRQAWWRTDGLTDGRTDAGNDNTRRPKLASGKNVKMYGENSSITYNEGVFHQDMSPQQQLPGQY